MEPDTTGTAADDVDRRWLGGPTRRHDHPDGVLEFSAGPRTDWFRDVRAESVVASAPVLVVADRTPVTASCIVEVDLIATFDAAGFFVHVDDEHWVKLVLERSPAGRPTVVTVRTDGWSDDCNHREIDGHSCRLRVTIDDRSIGLHVGTDDAAAWDLLRYAPLSTDRPPVIGLIVQSPTGDGTTGRFRYLRITDGSVEDLRDGS